MKDGGRTLRLDRPYEGLDQILLGGVVSRHHRARRIGGTEVHRFMGHPWRDKEKVPCLADNFRTFYEGCLGFKPGGLKPDGKFVYTGTSPARHSVRHEMRLEAAGRKHSLDGRVGRHRSLAASFAPRPANAAAKP